MSNITSCDSGSFSTENTRGELGQFHSPNSHTSTTTNNSNGSNTDSKPPPPPLPLKKKRNLPGNPDPSAEVISLSPNTLTTKNRFVCEICHKGFQRDQNLQLHRRGHNLPWKLKQRTGTEVRKRVYVCPEPSCVHHNPARALGDLTGIKKHFSRKHGEKKWKCDKCSKKYAVQSDLKAHSKICGTREYKCDCGTIFSRRDSFITHRAFCDALAEENHKANEEQLSRMGSNLLQGQPISNLLVSSLPNDTNRNPQIGSFNFNHHSDDQIQKHPLSLPQELNPAAKPTNNMASPSLQLTSSNSLNMFEENNGFHLGAVSPHMSATALLQKAAQMGATVAMSNTNNSSEKTTFVSTSSMAPPSFVTLVQQQQLSNDQNFFMNHQYINMQQHNDQHDISSQYNAFNGMVGMNGVEMFNVILDQSKALSKIIEQNSSRSSTSDVGVLQGGGATNGGSSSSSTINIGGNNKGSEDVMTLDLLGIGGGGGVGALENNFYGIGGAQQGEAAATDHEVWRNWSTKINSGFESFSAI